MINIKLTDRQEKILEIVKNNSPISGDEIAKKIKFSKSALRTDFSILTKLQLITSKTKVGYIYKDKYALNKVKDVMSPQNAISVDTSIYNAIIHLFNLDLGTILVVKNGSLAGIISRKDLLKAALNTKNIEKTPISMIMTRIPNIVFCYEDDTILVAIEKLIKHEIDSIPVLKREKNKVLVVGRFTKTNVTKLYFKELQERNI